MVQFVDPPKNPMKSHGKQHFPMVFLWFSYEIPIFQWFSYGFPLKVTAIFSILAYVWLIVILDWITPNVVEIWEAASVPVFFVLFKVETEMKR